MSALWTTGERLLRSGIAKHWIRHTSKDSLLRSGIAKHWIRHVSKDSASSIRWKERQAKDPYVKLAREQGYRARSAFKLLEINQKFKLLKPGQVLVECGAAPGAWTQIAAEAINAEGLYENDKPHGKIVSVDLLNFEEVKGAVILPGMDFTSAKTKSEIARHLGDENIRLSGVMSDMAPNASGVSSDNGPAIVRLAADAAKFALGNLEKENGWFLCKLWNCAEVKTLVKQLKMFFENVEITKPKSSRKDSSEIFLLARGFKGAVSK